MGGKCLTTMEELNNRPTSWNDIFSDSSEEEEVWSDDSSSVGSDATDQSEDNTTQEEGDFSSSSDSDMSEFYVMPHNTHELPHAAATMTSLIPSMMQSMTLCEIKQTTQQKAPEEDIKKNKLKKIERAPTQSQGAGNQLGDSNSNSTSVKLPDVLEQFTCDFCQKQFSCFDELQDHVLKHNNSTESES